MIERVTFTEEAEGDVISHYCWYESREPGLGEDFLRCVEACVLRSPSTIFQFDIRKAQAFPQSLKARLIGC
jgi:hypothetical protein